MPACVVELELSIVCNVVLNSHIGQNSLLHVAIYRNTWCRAVLSGQGPRSKMGSLCHFSRDDTGYTGLYGDEYNKYDQGYKNHHCGYCVCHGSAAS